MQSSFYRRLYIFLEYKHWFNFKKQINISDPEYSVLLFAIHCTMFNTHLLQYLLGASRPRCFASWTPVVVQVKDKVISR